MEDVEKRKFTQEQRDKMADRGTAMPDGSYPIANKKDLENAIQAYGRAKNPASVKRHIKERAKALGLESLLPDSWDVTKSTLTFQKNAAKNSKIIKSTMDETENKEQVTETVAETTAAADTQAQETAADTTAKVEDAADTTTQMDATETSATTDTVETTETADAEQTVQSAQADAETAQSEVETGDVTKAHDGEDDAGNAVDDAETADAELPEDLPGLVKAMCGVMKSHIKMMKSHMAKMDAHAERLSKSTSTDPNVAKAVVKLAELVKVQSENLDAITKASQGKRSVVTKSADTQAQAEAAADAVPTIRDLVSGINLQ